MPKVQEFLTPDAEVEFYKRRLAQANRTIEELRRNLNYNNEYLSNLERVASGLIEVLQHGRKLSSFMVPVNPEKSKWRWQVFVTALKSLDRILEEKTRERLDHKDISQQKQEAGK